MDKRFVRIGSLETTLTLSERELDLDATDMDVARMHELMCSTRCVSRLWVHSVTRKILAAAGYPRFFGRYSRMQVAIVMAFIRDASQTDWAFVVEGKPMPKPAATPKPALVLADDDDWGDDDDDWGDEPKGSTR